MYGDFFKRIFNVAQDLKYETPSVDQTHYTVVIDLAKQAC